MMQNHDKLDLPLVLKFDTQDGFESIKSAGKAALWLMR